MIIRDAEARDIPFITALYAHYVVHTTATWALEAPDVDAWRVKVDELQALGLPFLVLEDGDEDGEGAGEGTGPQGFAYLAPFRGRQGWLRTVEDTIYLREEATGRGYGARLLRALLDAANPHDVREVVAMISADVEGSIALHDRLGFRETGRLPRVGEKFGRSLDCVVMQRSLAWGS